MADHYKTGDHVNVYSSGNEAAMAVAGYIADRPREAVIVREHVSEPGTFEIEYADDGSTEFITDTQRLRALPQAKAK